MFKTNHKKHLDRLAEKKTNARISSGANGTWTINIGAIEDQPDHTMSVDAGGKLHGEANWRASSLKSDHKDMQNFYWHGMEVDRFSYTFLKASAVIANPIVNLFKGKDQSKAMTVAKVLEVGVEKGHIAANRFPDVSGAPRARLN